MSELVLVNAMYQISLTQFLDLFHESMIKSPKIAATQKRIQNINDYLTYRCWYYTTRGLYEKDKLLFTLLLALRIDVKRGRIKHEEFDIQKTERAFKDWFDKESSDLSPFPEPFDNLSMFHRFLLARCLSPDRTISEARNYIIENLGSKYSEPSVLNLETMWEESDYKTPLLGLLSSGADPTSNIQALAKKKGLETFVVSMGQGQEILARRVLQQSIANGGWAIFQNCHLGLEYMEEFYDTLMANEQFEHTFRTWLTTEVYPQFPIQVLQCSIKFTNEPPQGIRAGLKRTYALISQDKLEYIETPQWRPMLYSASFIHSVVQERRKFGPLGWNIPYEFNQTDWEASVQYIKNHLDDMNPKLGIAFKAVRYMISEIQYGGRITDDRDRRLMITYAKNWFGEFIFSNEFKYYDGYHMSKARKLEEVLYCIDKLPLIDPPQVFGLHPNADITYSTNLAKALLDEIVSIQPKEVGVLVGESREKIVHNVCGDMLSKLPANFAQHEVGGQLFFSSVLEIAFVLLKTQEKLRNMDHLNPMVIFLRQEIYRLNKVIRLVRNELTDLQLAIDGIIILNDSLRTALDYIYDGRVAPTWVRYSWESTTLGFLTAMRQEATRAHRGWSLDTVTMDNNVLRSYKDDIRDAPTEGVYVYGLFLEGAGWDRRNSRLRESQNKVLYVQMPIIHIFAINPMAVTAAGPLAARTKARSQITMRTKRTEVPTAPYVYLCPVYKKLMRTDLHFITMLKLNSNEHSDRWVLRGVALLCDIK
ncbi:unnamed protein product [Didymodactylos carnosus]|uniref:Dynein heavy chain n=1 Tax=Didymodactylos carnosus TaxID=1234261 RepID=A0A814EFM6_9BILA|nr:unnamed protein product [Didymodactylos carnosus]CAF1012028.1 unnamed protein product [Didymodactylos carnosus]CAF3744641.1 unnamed protein product [Didymodactylos carnosus]CAF3780918.1 unnamed protein product [Didymodactylos carnosus]